MDAALVRALDALDGIDKPAVRERLGLFAAEGVRSISSLLEAGLAPVHLLLTPDAEAPASWPPAVRVPPRVVRKLSGLSTPPGQLAVFALPRPAIDAHAGGIALVGVQDPGNVGTIIRAAAAFGWRQVVCVGGADPWGGKAVQASAGTIAAVALARVDALPVGAPWCALVPRGGQPPEQLPPGRRWLLIGSEGDGLPADVIERSQQRLTLPMPGNAESLNAAMAGSIAAYVLRL